MNTTTNENSNAPKTGLITAILVAIYAAVLLLMLSSKTLTANAKEESYTVSFSNYLETESEDGTKGWGGTTSFSCTVPQGYTFYGFRRDSDTYGIFTPCLVEDETDTIIYSTTTTFGNLLSNVTASRHLTAEDGGCIDDISKAIDTSYVFRSETEYTYNSRYINVGASCSFPIFDSKEALKTYLATGDDSGQVNKLKPDFDDAEFDSGLSFNRFMADNQISASWQGIVHSVSSVIQQEISASENAFVVVDFAYALKDYPTTVTTGVRHSQYYKISDNGFCIDWEDVQSENSVEYLYYIKVTPYYYVSDKTTGFLKYGNSSVAYYNPDGTLSKYTTTQNNASNSASSLREGTRYLNDFFLSGVAINTRLSSDMIITWTGTTTLPLVPDSDTLVIASYCAYGGDGTTTLNTFEYKTTTINSGSVVIDYLAISRECEEKGYVWDCEIRLTPCYTIDKVLYIGEQTVVNCNTGNITNESDDGNGTISKDDVTGLGNFDIDNITQYASYAFNLLSSLVNSMGSLPALFGTVFCFIPSFYIQAIGALLLIILILRVLGR